MNITQETEDINDIVFEDYQLFGSSDSIDYDIMVFVDSLGTTQENHDTVTELDRKLALIYTDKHLNANLALVEYGVVTEVFKGTADEVNNMLYLTYDSHEQTSKLKITRLVERDVELKILRTARVLLSFLSRTEHRPEIKKALKSDLIEKIKVLSSIDLSIIVDLGTRNVRWNDYLKTMAFQLGQTISLMRGTELYSKKEIIKTFPDLKSMLNREETEDLSVLEKYKDIFLEECSVFLPKMKKMRE